MRTAQRLFEGVDIGGETVGLITYMRTDSVQLSGEALGASRRLIGQRFGERYLPGEAARSTGPRPRTPRKRTRRSGRPTCSACPAELRGHLDDDQRRLYELIWKRTVASQMAAALLDRVTADIGVGRRRGGPARHRPDGGLRRLPQALPGRSRRPGRRGGRGRRACCRRWQSAIRCSSAQVTPAAALHRAAAALLRGEPGQEAGGAGHRPAQHLRQHHLGAAEPLLCPAGAEALRARGQGLAGQRVPGRESSTTGSQYDFTAQLEDQLDDVAGGSLFWKDVLREFWVPFAARLAEVGEQRAARGDRRARTMRWRRCCSTPRDGGPTRACARAAARAGSASSSAASGRSSAARATPTAATRARSRSAAARRRRRGSRPDRLLGRRPGQRRGGLAQDRPLRPLRAARQRGRGQAQLAAARRRCPTSVDLAMALQAAGAAARGRPRSARPASRSWPASTATGRSCSSSKKYVPARAGRRRADDRHEPRARAAQRAAQGPARRSRTGRAAARARPAPEGRRAGPAPAGPLRPLRQARQGQRQPAQGD